MANRPDITLYTTQTPNGIKISIALEELGYVLSGFIFLFFFFLSPVARCLVDAVWLTLLNRLPYKVEKIDISKNTQKEPYVLK